MVNILLLLVIASSPKEKVVVFDLESAGIASHVARASSKMLRIELRDIGTYDLVETEEFATTVKEADSIGNLLGADLAVIGSITRLRRKILAEVKLIKVGRARIIFEDDLTGDTEDDLDIVMKRLAMALSKREKAEKLVTTETVTGIEAEERRRRASYYTLGMKIGSGFPLFDTYNGEKSLLRGQLIGWYETPHLIGEISAGILFPMGSITEGFEQETGVMELPIDLSILYVPGLGDISPYFGGGLGVHFITIPNDAATGLGLNGGGGMIFFRTYDFHFFIDCRYNVVFADIGGKSPQQSIDLTIGFTRKAIPGKAKRGCCGEGFSIF
ncbi:MAG TPA: hypothetical protein EYP58_04655 [bacterium (Candidatus Stahlbacteria)]|nr:hypothetical protein [Candidatus Stahlbacteria bacterium]